MTQPESDLPAEDNPLEYFCTWEEKIDYFRTLVQDRGWPLLGMLQLVERWAARPDARRFFSRTVRGSLSITATDPFQGGAPVCAVIVAQLDAETFRLAYQDPRAPLTEIRYCDSPAIDAVLEDFLRRLPHPAA